MDDRPHQHVDEDDDGEEDSSAAGVYAEEQDEVAEETQDNNPHRVQLKEHVQHIQTACQRAQMLHMTRDTCQTQTRH